MSKPGRPKTSADIPCVCRSCGKHYVVPDWQLGGRHFCGRSCYFDYLKLHPNRATKEPDEKTCPVCGEVFLVGGTGRPNRKTVHCSRACAGNGRVRVSTALVMSPIDTAWLAGVFDGEGTIIKPRKTSLRSLRISVNNTCEPLVEKIYEVTGTGSVRFIPSHNPKHNHQWIWQCHGDNARSLLRQMLPWLIVKKEKAIMHLDEVADHSS